MSPDGKRFRWWDPALGPRLVAFEVMATQPAVHPNDRVQTRAMLQALRERNAESRERVLRHAANLGRIADQLRRLERGR
jgi:hypothetical protein